MSKSKRKPPKLPGGGKKYIAAQTQIRKETLNFHRNFAMQFVVDAAVIAAHETFGAGEKRIADFLSSLYSVMTELAEMTVEDAKDDKEILYMKAKLDETLKPLMGQNFKPYDERYSC